MYGGHSRKGYRENTEDLPELPVANGQLDKNEEEI